MKRIALFLISISLLSCGNVGKTHLTDLDYRRERGNDYFYKKDGTVFSGTAWSSDNKTIKLEVSNGIISNATLYHSNGKVASIGSNGNFVYYDTDGNTITERQFKKDYPELMAQAGAFEHEINYLK